jgi:hypothetical protein
MHFSDLLVILFITAGATQPVAFFAAKCSGLSRAESLRSTAALGRF